MAAGLTSGSPAARLGTAASAGIQRGSAMRIVLAGLLATLGLSTTTPSLAGDAPPPLVDGDCGEYATLGARVEDMGEGVVLHAYRNRDATWFCYTLPEGSFGGLDLRVDSDALPEPLNLHVSAQLGEWPAERPGLAPEGPASARWWNHHGWTAHWVRFNGMDADATPPRPRFRTGGARELQLAHPRFGEGEWRLVFQLQRVRGADGSFVDLRFPEEGAYRLPALVEARQP